MEESERVFLQGMEAHEAGIPFENCPHQISVSWVNWQNGWRFSRLTKVQSYRRNNTEKIRSALEEYRSFEEPYSRMQAAIVKGVFRQPLKHIAAKKNLAELEKKLSECASVRLLRDLYFRDYIWRDEDNTYHFLVKDDILAAYYTRLNDYEGPMRKLRELYGDRHGVQSAWSEYVRTCTEYTAGFDRSSL